ncbi:hypothetical protein SAMN05421755_10458 [Nitrosomonas sp. Nm33]|nr:hypothetical protein SAMN05421755_10458 [Nitrosomonas sp. Nm33]
MTKMRRLAMIINQWSLANEMPEDEMTKYLLEQGYDT